jgi:predicted lipoprotein with Yx(FWY)xxD motif
VTRRPMIVAAALASVALIAAGCGSSNSGAGSTTASGAGSTQASSGGLYGNSSSSTSTPAPAAKTSSVASIKTAKTPLGAILVDSKGQTLYLWKADTGTTSTCAGACAQAWPPALTTGTPKAAGSATAKLLGTSKRSDGRLQVTYDRQPLYTFAGDSAAGQTNGQGSTEFGAEWDVVSPQGKAITG